MAKDEKPKKQQPSNKYEKVDQISDLMKTISGRDKVCALMQYLI